MTARRDGPLRTCIGCRTVRPQTELVRCTIDHDGRIVADRHASGRGAWVCGVDCVDLAVRRKGFQRAWRRPVDPAAVAALRHELAADRHLNSDDNEAGGERPQRCETP